MSSPAIAVLHRRPRFEENSRGAGWAATLLGPAFIGALALALAIVVLIGWLSGNPALTTFIPGAVPMKANAALLLGLAGLGILLRATGHVRRGAPILAIAVAVVTLATGLEYLAQVDLGIDNLLASDTVISGGPYPGRMAVMTVVAYGACSVALLLLGRTWRGLHPSEPLALVAGAIGALGVLGYAYGAVPLTVIGSETRISLPASVGFVLLAGGIIASDADHGLTRILRDPHLSGRLARRLVGIALVILPLTGVFANQLGQLESVGPANATALLVVLQLVALLVAGGWVIEGTRRIERRSASLAEALAVSERRFREALSDVSLAAVMLDVRGGVTFANRFVLELMGRTESEVIGRDWFEMSVPPADTALRRAAYGDSIEQGMGLLQRRGPLLQRDGEVRQIEWSSAYMRDETGRIVGMVGVGSDVTEHRKAHEAVEASETRLRTALDAMLDGTSILSAIRNDDGEIVDFRIDYANPAMAHTGQVGTVDSVGRNLLELFPAHRTNGLFRAYAQVVETGVPFKADDFRYIDPDAASGPLDQHLDLGAAKLGDGYVQSVRDVSDRHTAQAELVRLAMAIEQSADAIVMTDAAARIEYVNPAFTQITGYTREEVLGRNPRILKSGVQRASFYAEMWAALSSGEPFSSEVTNRRKDGSLYQEEQVISPVIDGSGAITSYVAVQRDVTRERAISAEHDRLTTQRDLIARTLSDLKAGSSSAATAEAICRQVVNLPGVLTANINYFATEGTAMSLAFVRGDGIGVADRRIPVHRTRAIRALAEAGAWAEPWVRRPWHPYDRLFTELGVSAVAHAPIIMDGRLIGTLSVSATGADAVTVLRDSLPAIIEFAGFAGALLGTAILDLNEIGNTRARIAEIIRFAAFHPAFQPVVDVVSGERVGYEALTRFANGMRPDAVFSEAREAGLDGELELATLKAAILAAAELPPGSWLSLNVSPKTATTEKRLARLLRLADRPLVLEITEHVAVADYAALRAAIGHLRPAVRVAVDDAGSGTANLSHIVELRPAFVKLDIGLVRGIDTDLTRKAMVFGLVHFATESHSETIAEGVETQAELESLRAIGVRFAQGYLLGRPAPVADWSAPGGKRSRVS
jgi:PAS domain S-box-containing protein